MNIDGLISEFTTRFNATPRLFRAPGRVNLIGEHTDYNDGFVMPFALDRQTIVAGRKRDDRLIEAIAHDLDETATIDLDAEPKKQRHSWVDYVEGTARSLEGKFGKISGADILISSDVPIGSGLSSSAALETSIGFALLSLSGIEIDREQLAFCAQRAEHEYAGIRSGIMDQFASSFCKKGNAMLLDCRSLERTQIQFETPETITVACDTNVKHSLASTEYNKRREECEEGVKILGEYIPSIRALRDVTIEQLEQYKASLPEVVYRRCRHVITENDRTLKAAEAFERHDSVEAGKLMFESHRSLRDDYEVSCSELDVLVEIAKSVDGVYGARMTGGGFGGCTVNLVRRDAFEAFAEKIRKNYKEKFDKEPEIYKFQAADGASEIVG
ncbi:MAG TPA: galactokinase [Pyrinomonadaceae bacterium]|nr:galactokinase [Pyrinomonadaceae bacterium]